MRMITPKVISIFVKLLLGQFSLLLLSARSGFPMSATQIIWPKISFDEDSARGSDQDDSAW
jgi:hypothetical protein